MSICRQRMTSVIPTAATSTEALLTTRGRSWSSGRSRGPPRGHRQDQQQGRHRPPPPTARDDTFDHGSHHTSPHVNHQQSPDCLATPGQIEILNTKCTRCREPLLPTEPRLPTVPRVFTAVVLGPSFMTPSRTGHPVAAHCDAPHNGRGPPRCGVPAPSTVPIPGWRRQEWAAVPCGTPSTPRIRQKKP